MLTHAKETETTTARIEKTVPFKFGPRRGVLVNVADRLAAGGGPLDAAALAHCETFDLLYRTLCAVMYNYAPLSGHPGGSISSGRFVSRLLFETMDYDLGQPGRQDADIISYAAGHKALGLYAFWALRNDIARIAASDLLPRDEKFQLRIEDLLGFRRNPVNAAPLARQFRAKALDGHPIPATPFVRLSTGASGVGLPASLGLVWGAADLYGADAPRVHIIEGEGGLTPGRVAEALATAGTASLGLPPASSAAQGVCRLRTARGKSSGTIVLQGTGVTNAFLAGALSLLDREKIDLNVYAITSTELFDLLSLEERDRVFPEAHQQEAMGITDFTLATMTRWVRLNYGREHTLHPFRGGHFLGSGSGAKVMVEAGLDGANQFEAIRAYVRDR